MGKTLIPAPPPTTKGQSEHGRQRERRGRMHRGREREIWIYTAYVYACIYTCTYTRSRVHRCTPAQSESRQAYCTVSSKKKIDQKIYMYVFEEEEIQLYICLCKKCSVLCRRSVRSVSVHIYICTHAYIPDRCMYLKKKTYRFMRWERPNYTFLWAGMNTLTRCPNCGTCGFRIFRGSDA